MENSLGRMTEMVLDIFYSATRSDKIKLEVEYVDDIYSRRLELACNDKEKGDVIRNKPFIEGLNGTMVMSKSKDGTHYILISKSVLNEGLQFISTLIHELTHIHDFIDFTSEFCNGDFESVEQHDLFKPYYYWTEFNAKRNGYLYYRKIIFEIEDANLSIEEQVDHILKTELKVHYDYLLENLKEYKYDRSIHFYNIIQFMGRFSVWEDLFPDRINPHVYLPDYLQSNYGPKIIELYETLRSMANFNIAKGKLEQLENLLDCLFFKD